MKSCEMERQHAKYCKQKPYDEKKQHSLLHRELPHMTAAHIAEDHAEYCAQYGKCKKRTCRRITESKAIGKRDEIQRRKDICCAPHKHPE